LLGWVAGLGALPLPLPLPLGNQQPMQFYHNRRYSLPMGHPCLDQQMQAVQAICPGLRRTTGHRQRLCPCQGQKTWIFQHSAPRAA